MAEQSDEYCDITCEDIAAFKTWQPRDLDSIVELLEQTEARKGDGRISKAKADDIGKVCGFNYNKSGLLASTRLRLHCPLLDCATYDWVHTALQDGVFVIEASLIVQACGGRMEATSL